MHSEYLMAHVYVLQKLVHVSSQNNIRKRNRMVFFCGGVGIYLFNFNTFNVIDQPIFDMIFILVVQ